MTSRKTRNHGNDESSSLDVVERFDTYENYLDSQLTAADMNYLEDDEMARQLVELGYRGLGDTIRRDVRTVHHLVACIVSSETNSPSTAHTPQTGLRGEEAAIKGKDQPETLSAQATRISRPRS